MEEDELEELGGERVDGRVGVHLVPHEGQEERHRSVEVFELSSRGGFGRGGRVRQRTKGENEMELSRSLGRRTYRLMSAESSPRVPCQCQADEYTVVLGE